MTNTITFNVEKLKSSIADQKFNPKNDWEFYGSKESYLEWLDGYIEEEIVQPLEREAAEDAGFSKFDFEACINIDEARDTVDDFLMDVKSELFDDN